MAESSPNRLKTMWEKEKLLVWERVNTNGANDISETNFSSRVGGGRGSVGGKSASLQTKSCYLTVLIERIHLCRGG